MLRMYLKIWEWELIFSHAVKGISSRGVRAGHPLDFVVRNLKLHKRYCQTENQERITHSIVVQPNTLAKILPELQQPFK